MMKSSAHACAGAAEHAMCTVTLEHEADFHGWRVTARELLYRACVPEAVTWQVAGTDTDLFADADGNEIHSDAVGVGVASPHRVPREFLSVAERVVCHRDPHRFALLYRVLWRLTHGEPELLSRITDDDVHVLTTLEKAVSRDHHKMTAFVRFRRTPGSRREHYSAWFEPAHHILRLASDFFCKRFSNMDWSIYTPDGSAHWNRSKVVFGPPVDRKSLPEGEHMEELWRTYFANIFNPARLRLDAMRAEMPVKYWKNLPEAPLIAQLVHDAGSRTHQMVDAAPTTAPRYAAAATYSSFEEQAVDSMPLMDHDALRRAASDCSRCAHACDATQCVFGQGNTSARLMLVGEQPGDVEDVRGRPFVGPAGKVIRSILDELSVADDEVYFTNAVKHFKYTIRGKRRLHQRPGVTEIDQCRPWLAQELALVRPELVIALGATAARALLLRPVRVEYERGSVHRLQVPGTTERWSTQVLITGHPAAILRAGSASERRRARQRLRQDMADALQQVLQLEVGSTGPVSNGLRSM